MASIPLKRHPCSFLSRTIPAFGLSTNATPIEGHPSQVGALDASYPVHIIWGANTDVGKTLVSAGLAASCLMQEEPNNVLYLKPVQTGFPLDSDAKFVARKVKEIIKNRAKALAVDSKLKICNQTVYVSPIVGQFTGTEEEQIGAGKGDFSDLYCKTLWGWHEPVSPHLAVQNEGGFVSDGTLLESIRENLSDFATQRKAIDINRRKRSWAIVETAGGVASPGPSGALQCDIYRPVRLPGILVGDGKLGGISCTIAAYESLKLRGYDICSILLIDYGLGNEEALAKYMTDRVRVMLLPPLPSDPHDNMLEWFGRSEATFFKLRNILDEEHRKRIQRLDEMPSKASNVLWWPFTQHSLVPESNVTLIDSRCGELFSVYKRYGMDEACPMIMEQFDSCASWWTQGPDSVLQNELARQIAYAAGRYGHVMFPENVHEPALRCAELLLQGVGNGWANRVFYSDNGSTAVEVALKMAFRKFAVDHGHINKLDDNSSFTYKVLALKGSYHGDTLGAMEAQAPSAYTGFLQQPWYSGRGLFLDAPTLFFKEEHWHLHIPNAYKEVTPIEGIWKSKVDAFAMEREDSQLAQVYSAFILDKLSGQVQDSIAALILEPVMHGAGGMVMVDPLFQRILVRECKCHQIPVIFDEVFTGLWRLGAQSAAEILGCFPDIACYAKLLTGGTVPLAATLASETVFQAFEGTSKLHALLHGHSYTAHAIGCTAAVTAMSWFKDSLRNGNLLQDQGRLRELWEPRLVDEISNLSSVKRVTSFGTVFAVELQADILETGYNSLVTKDIVTRLRQGGVYARPLGNVLYLMCGPLTPPSSCAILLESLLRELC